MFIHTGLIMQLDTPNQLSGVLAHETGHIADGHLVRMMAGVRAASVPLILSMVLGVAAIAAGAGDVGSAILMGGQQIAQRSFLAFTRTQESAADQAAIRYLAATKQSGRGMVAVFKRFENQEILSDQRRDPFAQSHPVAGDRISALESLIEASPYRDVRDSPEAQYAYDMLRAKLRGYIDRPEVTLRRYPQSDTSKPARYARAMAYFRQPDMGKALAEMGSLLKEEPENPYFLEMYGQINVEIGKVEEGIQPYTAAVKILPDAPLLRVALGAAMLGTENPRYVEPAIKELQASLEARARQCICLVRARASLRATWTNGASGAGNRRAVLRALRLPTSNPIRRARAAPAASRLDGLATSERHHRHRDLAAG